MNSFLRQSSGRYDIILEIFYQSSSCCVPCNLQIIFFKLNNHAMAVTADTNETIWMCCDLYYTLLWNSIWILNYGKSCYLSLLWSQVHVRDVWRNEISFPSNITYRHHPAYCRGYIFHHIRTTKYSHGVFSIIYSEIGFIIDKISPKLRLHK